MKYDNQLRYAVNIIKDYDGRYPLSVWLKDFFRENKQMGSRDRRIVNSLVYGYYRLGHNQFDSIGDRVLAGLYSGGQQKELADYFQSTHAPVAAVSRNDIFPWKDDLCEDIDADAFSASFLVQPDLFIRIRPGYEKEVTDKLNAQHIPFTDCGGGCVALSNSTRADAILELNREAVVQDRSSQLTGSLIKHIPFEKVWDCCAASGGKSIMIRDMRPEAELTVSDIRGSIIANLKERFRQAGIGNYRSLVADISSPSHQLPGDFYDLIVADVPCTGSGTWARTPEQLYFFQKEKIGHYSALQKKIVTAVLPKMAPGGYLLYITCSVFKQENDEVVSFLSSKENLRLDKREVIKGYNDRADTMFAALFTNAPA